MELIDFKSSEKLLKKYKIPLSKEGFVLDVKEAVRVAKKIKYPVFLKIYGKNILHRIDIGGIKKVENAKELEKEFLRMRKIPARLTGGKGIDGIVVQGNAEGKEVIVGMRRDPQFGPTIMVGAGGIFTEAINDFVLRVCPINEADAMKMLQELKSLPYLEGKRDNKSINFKEVTKIVANVSKMAMENEEISEITFNPIISNSKKAVVVDFKIQK